MDELSLYDYELPDGLIARQPPPTRDASRMLLLNRKTGTIEHLGIRDLPGLLRAGDCLVLNDTRVIPARLLGRRLSTGGKWEGLYLSCSPSGEWRLIGQTRGRLAIGERLAIHPAHGGSAPDLILELRERNEEGIWLARPELCADPLPVLERYGTVPLPPYLQRGLATELDWNRYQTEYARRPGAVAAPTAGLHLTSELLERCRQQGVETAWVTLHVGIGTFRPVTSERLSDHRMHSEWCELSEETARKVRECRASRGRVVAVGTTSVRTIESAFRNGQPHAFQGETDLFLRPPCRFQGVDCLLTNFHLPRSTLFILVCAFAGTDLVKTVYAEAIRENYRFYSYGDAMLIV